MKIKSVKLNAPTVKELIDALEKFPPDAIITESDIGTPIGINIQNEHHHRDDDGYGNSVDYEIAELSLYSLDSDY